MIMKPEEKAKRNERREEVTEGNGEEREREKLSLYLLNEILSARSEIQ